MKEEDKALNSEIFVFKAQISVPLITHLLLFH